MPIAEKDTRLLKGLKDARNSIAGFGFTGEPKDWADAAYGLLDRSYLKLQAAVNKEDAEEVEADEAVADLGRARDDLNEAFADMWHGYQMRLSELKIEGGFDDQASELDEYLSERTASEIDSIDLQIAVQTVERARRYADRFLPTQHRAEVVRRVDTALAEVEAARAEAS